MNRRKSREVALQLIFESFFRKDEQSEDIISTYAEETDEYSIGLFCGVMENIASLDEMISKQLQNWTIDRISKISHAILLLSSYEILYGGIEVKISINEAVELSKKYGDDKAPAFVNGVMGKIAYTNGKV